ncbi:MAG: IS256 family transposase [Streptosporangiaceae bacterium]
MEERYHTPASPGESGKTVKEQLKKGLGPALGVLLRHSWADARELVLEALQQGAVCLVEALLRASAEEVAGARTQGRQRGDVLWHGEQAGRVVLAECQLRVRRPRLRHREGRELKIPAYEQLQRREQAQRRMLELLMRGVSTRNYGAILPAMADAAGVSPSSVSREAAQAAEARLQELMGRGLEGLDLCVIYIDGIVFGEHHLIGAVGVDAAGRKHVLGVQDGATENAAAVKDLLENLISRGLNPAPPRLFVIDGAKALRSAVSAVFGPHHPVQRCRVHKIRNVVERLPKPLRSDLAAALRAAYRLPTVEGERRLRHLAASFASSYPAAAHSLLDGLEETFTINRLNLPLILHRSLGSTNVIESAHAGVRQRIRRVTHWRSGAMAARWAAAAFLSTEASFKRLMGYRDLPILIAVLQRLDPAAAAAQGVA